MKAQKCTNRDLTESEARKAPAWATHYQFCGGSLIWESKNFFMTSSGKKYKQKSELTMCRKLST